MIVVDASALLDLLLGTGKADAVEARLFGGASLHAPHLLDLEVLQVLRRYRRAGELSRARASAALEDLGDMPIERYPHQPFIGRIWALRDNATAYDAAYLTLAEVLGARLVTLDARLSSVPGHTARVDVI